MKKMSVLWLILTIVVATAASAAVPRTISYQGMLKNSGGSIVPDGGYILTFRIYNAADTGTALWTEMDSVTVADGVFSTILGQSTLLNLAFDRTYWLSIQVGSGGELSPRMELTSSPYAIRAAVADSALTGGTGPDSDWQYSASNIYRLTGSVGVGTSTPGAKLEVIAASAIGIRSTTDGASGTAAIIGITGTNGCSAIEGTANSDGYGVKGFGRDYIGVGGFTNSAAGYGAYGYNQVSTNYGYLGGNTYGAYGLAASSSGSGVYGKNNFVSSVGSLGTGQYGVYGSGPTGVYGTSTQLEGVRGYTSGAGSKGVYGEHSSGNYGWLGDDSYGVYGYSASGYAGYFDGKAKVTSNLEVGNIARVFGTTWPATGKSMEIAYSSSLHKGYVQVFDRGTSTWGDLYLGGGKVGIGTVDPARALHVVDVMRLEPRTDFPASPSDGDLCVKGASGSRHIYCYLNGAWKQLD